MERRRSHATSAFWTWRCSFYAVTLLLLSLSAAIAQERGLPDRDPGLACELVKNEDALLLDVRTWWEYTVYRLPDSKNIWVSELSERLDEVAEALEGEKNKPIVVYCSKGVRAAEAKKILLEAGFSRVTNLGGVSDWKACD